jgi:phosphoserine phosphatase
MFFPDLPGKPLAQGPRARVNARTGIAVLYLPRLRAAVALACLTVALASVAPAARRQAPGQSAADAMPSCNDGASKKAIVEFVGRVTRAGKPDFVPVSERIATFDNDGTLWAEKPVPFQVMFAFDRVKAMAPEHADWKTKEPFASVLKGDMAAVAASGEKGVLEIVAATHTGMTTEEFTKTVTDWIATARHPKTGRLYTEMVYQPMLELLAYLRANGFKTFIVSGGGVEFMRPWAERVYGIPPEQVVGSAGKLKLEMRDGRPVLVKLAAIDLIDDKEGKPVGIQSRIGRRPIAAFGNSDGDLQMLEWAAAGSGARFALFVHHDDAAREYAYDRNDTLQTFAKGWDEAVAKGWTVVSMKNDWKTIFPPGNGSSGQGREER